MYNVSLEEQAVIDLTVDETKAQTYADGLISSCAQIVEGIDEALDCVQDLERVGGILESGIMSGEGLDPQAAHMAEIAIEAICARVGLDTKRGRGLPALESFAPTAGRLGATKLALEENQNFIARVWKGIKAALQAIWNAIKSFFGISVQKTKQEEAADAAFDKKIGGKRSFSQNTHDTRLEQFGDSHLASSFTVDGKANPQSALFVLEETTKALQTGLQIADACERFASDVRAEEGHSKMIAETEDALRRFSPKAIVIDSVNHYGTLIHRKAIAFKADGVKLLACKVKTTDRPSSPMIDAPFVDDLVKVDRYRQQLKEEFLKFVKNKDKFEDIKIKCERMIDQIQEKFTVDGVEYTEDQRPNAVEKRETRREELRAVVKLLQLQLSLGGITINTMTEARIYSERGYQNLKEK